MVGILVSFWEGPFSGAMLVSGRVLDIVSDVNQAPENYISEMLCKNFCANKKRLQNLLQGSLFGFFNFALFGFHVALIHFNLFLD